MKKFFTAAIAAASIALVGCGGGGGGTAHNPDTGETLSCTALDINTVNCGGDIINVAGVTNMRDNGNGTYTVTYNGQDWVIRPDNYASTVYADIVTAHINGVDGTGNIAVVDFFRGADAGHGRHVRGIIDAIAPGANSREVDVSRQGPNNDIIDIVIADADTNGIANVYNFSLGSYANDVGGTYNYTLEEIENASTNIIDGVMVVAAGNDALGDQLGSNGQRKDCSTLDRCNSLAIELIGQTGETTIVVGSINADGTALEEYSTQAGLLQDYYIVAPVVPDRAGGRGTSYAAPVVAGVASLIMDNMNNTNAQAVRNRILTTADDLGARGVDSVYGHGRLNVGRALSPVGGLR